MCSIWCLDMAHRLKNEEHFPESPLLQAPSYNSTKLHRLPYRYSQWKSSPRLFRRVTPCEHILIMRLLMIIERICRKNGIKFMMCDGTLFLSVQRIESTYIDGIQLYNEVRVYMARLNKFAISIHTLVFNRYITIDPPSIDDIQYNFIKINYQQVG
jgi:hypothetical protein